MFFTHEGPDPAHPPLWTVEQVAAFLRISRYTARKWAREKTLPAYFIGRELRFDRAEIIKWLASRRGSSC